MQESMMPATVKVPPTMAQIVVMKWYSGGRVSWYFTVIGFKSYLKGGHKQKIGIATKQLSTG